MVFPDGEACLGLETRIFLSGERGVFESPKPIPGVSLAMIDVAGTITEPTRRLFIQRPDPNSIPFL